MAVPAFGCLGVSGPGLNPFTPSVVQGQSRTNLFFTRQVPRQAAKVHRLQTPKGGSKGQNAPWCLESDRQLPWGKASSSWDRSESLWDLWVGAKGLLNQARLPCLDFPLA